MILSDYTSIRSKLHTGDIIAFSGCGLTSAIVKTATQSTVSHVGIVLQTHTNNKSFHFVQLIESTSLDGYTGVTLTRLSTRASQYNGTIWALPLSIEVRKHLDEPRLIEFLLSQHGKPYDLPQAILAFIDKILPDTPQDFSRMFCSELVAAGLIAGGALPSHLPINPSELTPKDVIDLPIYEECYHIHGPVQEMY